MGAPQKNEQNNIRVPCDRVTHRNKGGVIAPTREKKKEKQNTNDIILYYIILY